MGLRLFEYAIIQQPLKSKDGKVTDEGRLLVGVKTILAKDESHVQMLAAREVPADAMEDLDRLEVVVRPFERKVLGVSQVGARGPIGVAGTPGIAGADGWAAYSMMPSPSTATYTPMTSVGSSTSGGGLLVHLNE